MNGDPVDWTNFLTYAKAYAVCVLNRAASDSTPDATETTARSNMRAAWADLTSGAGSQQEYYLRQGGMTFILRVAMADGGGRTVVIQ